MKILHIEYRDTDGYGDWLTEAKAKEFIDGEYIHVESEGSIFEA